MNGPDSTYDGGLAAGEDEFAKEFLDRNNIWRAAHGSPSLELSSDLCEHAHRWAEKLANRRHISFCELAGVGENITFFPPSMSATEVVDYWYSEHTKYEYETPGWQAGTNYFTQLIWKSTRQVGVGRAFVPQSNRRRNGKIHGSSECLAGQQVVVAFYRPAGNNNRAGQFALNVSKPLPNDDLTNSHPHVPHDPE